MNPVSPISLGHHVEIIPAPTPRVYRIRSGARYVEQLEPGTIRKFSDFHEISICDENGHFHCSGDYGIFDYFWTATGDQTLHAFLYDLDFDYFMKKASTKPHRVFDPEKSFKDIRRTILEGRKDGNYDKELARGLWDATEGLDDVGSKPDYYDFLNDDPLLYKYFYPGDWSPSTKEHPGLRRFWEEVWKPFCETTLKPHFDAWRAKRAENSYPV
jgi:hypothetical protein